MTDALRRAGPFVFDGEVTDRAGVTQAETRCNYWPTQERTADVGESYDFRGVCDEGGREALVEHQNRVLEANGERFNVIAARWLPILRFCDLRLRRSLADG